MVRIDHATAPAQASVERDMAQGDGQQHDAPQALDGEVVAALAAGGGQAVAELLMGDAAEEVAQGSQGGAVVEAGPGEEGLGGVDVHGAAPLRWRGQRRQCTGQRIPPARRWLG
jgi:hypothetical protein